MIISIYFDYIEDLRQKQNPTRWVGQWWLDPETMTAAIYNEIET